MYLEILVVIIWLESISTLILFRLIWDCLSASAKQLLIESTARSTLKIIELCIPVVFFLEKPISFAESPINEKIAHLRINVS